MSYLINFYNNGNPTGEVEAVTFDDAFDLAVNLMKEKGYSACYVYSDTGSFCLHLTYNGLFGERE